VADYTGQTGARRRSLLGNGDVAIWAPSGSWSNTARLAGASHQARCATRVVRVDGYSVSVYREPMIQSFADATTADLWDERNTKAARRVPRGLWPVVHRKLTMLDSAQRLDDLAAVPGNRLEALAGDRKGQHSIRVNQQYRITFRWEKHDAHNVCCEDYH
jgi:proteic killer suppression protein